MQLLVTIAEEQIKNFDNDECWLCGQSPVINNQAEHVFPMSNMFRFRAIFSKKAQGFTIAGMTIKEATEFITNFTIDHIDSLKLEECILLISELFKSDECCNQIKGDSLFKKHQTSERGDQLLSYEPNHDEINRIITHIVNSITGKRLQYCQNGDLTEKKLL